MTPDERRALLIDQVLRGKGGPGDLALLEAVAAEEEEARAAEAA